ncbi:ribonuclease HII [Candidatus Woesearchaeota archaeon]|nr:ribonuclease HII [Candidatus Woesearchaeota archaeon]
MIICGIDEAGRGPVIGPMVMAAVVINTDSEAQLKKLGVKDSKLLQARQREALFDPITGHALSFKIIVLSPQQIDDALTSDSLNLNKLEAHTSADLLNNITLDHIDQLIVDCPSPNTKQYSRFLKPLLKKNVELVAEHKADVNHIVVAAASILAKVVRDEEIKKIQQCIGEDIGSGYLTDPKTVAFLEKHFEDYPDIFRKQWAPFQKMVFGKNQRKLGEF